MAQIIKTLEAETFPFLEKDDQSFTPDRLRWHEEGFPTTLYRRLLQWLADYRLTFLLLANSFLLLVLIFKQVHHSDPTLALFSPANHLVSYKTVMFTGELDEQTKYMPSIKGGLPDDEVDQNWEDLYRSTIIQVPREDAAKLVNWTSPVPGDETNYITMLDVYHQLHCLNLIRRSLYPERYHGQMWTGIIYVDMEPHHLEHCIDSLRQLITCHSDVSTHYWRWNPKADPPQSQNFPRVYHTCRDFEAIQEWAGEHKLTDFARLVKAEDPLRKGKETMGAQ